MDWEDTSLCPCFLFLASPWEKQHLNDNHDDKGKSSSFLTTVRGAHGTSSEQEMTQLSGTGGPVFWMFPSTSSNYGIF